LVTGSSGQLGQALAHTQPAGSILTAYYPTKQELDITNTEKLLSYFQAHPANFLINCAAYTNVDLAEKDHVRARLINATAPAYLAKLSKERGITLIHISTDYVFAGTGNQPLTEMMPAIPINYYGKTKLEGEQNILTHHPTAYIIRTSWLYSEYGNNFLTRLLARTSQEKHVPMTYEQVSSPTYAIDLAQAIWEIVFLLHQNPDQYQPGIYHYANQGVASRYDFAWVVGNQLDLACKVQAQRYIQLPHLANRPFYTLLDTNKIQRTFGLTIPHWQESLTHCLKNIARY
jgi:dTDP-4-dehydrorhamnose reductase